MKKKGIPVIVILLILLVLIGAAVFAYIFLKTDIFKPADELFTNNLLVNKDLVSFLQNENMEIQENTLKQNNYISTGSLTVNTQNDEEIKTINAITTVRRDIYNNRTYKDITLKSKEGTDILNVSYINSDDTYGIKCSDILPYYFGIKNDNLQALISEYVSESYATSFPDKIDFEEKDIVSEQEVESLIKTYCGVIANNIPKESYSKNGKVELEYRGNKVNANEYALSLDTQQLENILINCLQTAKNDTTTINIIKRLISEQFTIDEYTEQIDLIIQGINKDEQNINLTVKVYELNGSCIKTIFEISSKSVNGEDRIAQITVEINNISNQSKSIVIKAEEKTSNKIYANFQINIEKIKDEKSIMNRITVFQTENNVSNKLFMIEKKIGNLSENTISNSISISMEYMGETTEATYNKNIQIVPDVEEIMELKSNNSIILNNYKKKQIESLYNKNISKKIPVILSKINQAGINLEDSNTANMLLISALSIMSSNSTQGIKNLVAPIGVMSMKIGLSLYNNASETVSDVSMDKMAVRQFNGQFEPYLNRIMSSIETKSLIDTVNYANQNEEQSVILSGVTTKSEVETGAQYKAEANYSNEYISEIIITRAD